MYQFPIGVLLESFRESPRQAMESARALGLSGVQVYACGGYFDIDGITETKKRELRTWLSDNGLTLTAVCGDFICGNPEVRFSDPSKSQYTLEKSKRILDFAKEVGTDIVTTHVGVVPADPASDKFAIVQSVCGQLAEYADQLQAHFAIETGPEVATTLKQMLDSLSSRGVGVNLDPANLVMVTGDDPVQAVYTLRDYIVHTHAKDGVMLVRGNPEVIYGEIETEIQNMTYFKEVPLGQGSVPFRRYLEALKDIGYRGYLTIEREVGETPKADIAAAIDFLKRQMEA